MRSSIKLSAIALLAAMLASAPAQAVSLNNNGNLLGTDGADATANVTGGDLLGNGGNTTANVDAQIGGSDPTTANVDVNTGGSNPTGANVDINTGGSSPTTANVNVNAGNNGVLDTGILGDGNDSTTADVNLGDTGNASADLFGGDGSNASVTLGSATDDTIDSLFGDTAVPSVDVGSVGDTVNDLLTNATDDLFGNQPGAIDGGGDATGVPSGGADGGTDLFGPTANDGSGSAGGPGSNGGVQIASLNDDGTCLDPSASQLGKLINRHAYTPATMSSWRGTTTLKIVKIDLCDAAKARLDASNNIAALQDYLAANPTFTAHLKSKGYLPDDVIGVDRNGKTLIVYVT